MEREEQEQEEEERERRKKTKLAEEGRRGEGTMSFFVELRDDEMDEWDELTALDCLTVLLMTWST